MTHSLAHSTRLTPHQIRLSAIAPTVSSHPTKIIWQKEEKAPSPTSTIKARQEPSEASGKDIFYLWPSNLVYSYSYFYISRQISPTSWCRQPRSWKRTWRPNKTKKVQERNLLPKEHLFVKNAAKSNRRMSVQDVRFEPALWNVSKPTKNEPSVRGSATVPSFFQSVTWRITPFEAIISF